MTNDDIIDTVLKYEGGFTNNPADRGGPTNFGITAADYGRWMGRSAPATADEVRMMPVATAREIYSKWYITDPGFDKVKSDPLRLVLVDSGVLFGVGRATIWLQQELNLHPDGKIGDSVLAALQNYQPAEKLPRRVLGRRFGAIADIVKSKPTQVVFLGGWINRAVSLLDYV